MSEKSTGLNVLLTFAELEFIFQDDPRWPLMRDQFNGVPPACHEIIDAGMTSLLVRDMATIGPDHIVTVRTEVKDLTSAITESPCPVGVALMLEAGAAPAVYCPTRHGKRALVSVELPGILLLQDLPNYVPPVDQAMQLVEKAASVPDVVVGVKAVNQAGCLFRRQGAAWQLGDLSRDPADLDSFFQPSTQAVVMDAARVYLTQHLGPVLSEDGQS